MIDLLSKKYNILEEILTDDVANPKTTSNSGFIGMYFMLLNILWSKILQFGLLSLQFI